jgi:hypothetical protein
MGIIITETKCLTIKKADWFIFCLTGLGQDAKFQFESKSMKGLSTAGRKGEIISKSKQKFWFFGLIFFANFAPSR